MTSVSSLTGRRAYFDANVFIYALNAFPQFTAVLPPLLEALDTGRLVVATSELTVAELLVKPFQDNDIAAEAACRAMVFGNSRLNVVPVSRSVLIEAARLRAATTVLKLPDAIHAATAKLAGCDLLLTNDARFPAAGLPMDVVLLSDMTP